MLAIGLAAAGWRGVFRSAGALAWRPGRSVGLVAHDELVRARRRSARQMLLRMPIIGEITSG